MYGYYPPPLMRFRGRNPFPPELVDPSQPVSTPPRNRIPGRILNPPIPDPDNGGGGGGGGADEEPRTITLNIIAGEYTDRSYIQFEPIDRGWIRVSMNDRLQTAIVLEKDVYTFSFDIYIDMDKTPANPYLKLSVGDRMLPSGVRKVLQGKRMLISGFTGNINLVPYVANYVSIQNVSDTYINVMNGSTITITKV